MIVKKTKKHVPVIRQLTQTECGLCCCVAILNYYKSKESVSDLQKELDVGRDGMSIIQIRDYLRSKNIETKIYKISNINSLFEPNIPFIVFWEENHFVVVEKFTNKTVTVMDPAKGRIKMTFEEFCAGFSSYVALPSPNEQFVRQKKSNEHPWRYIGKALLHRKALLLIILCAMSIVYGITFYLPNFVQWVIDEVTVGNEYSSSVKYIAGLGIVFASYVLISILRSLKIISLNVYLSEKIEADTFKKLLMLPYSYFELRSAGDILYRLNCTTAIKELLSTQVVSGIIDVGSIVIVCVYMFNKSLLLAGASVLFAVVEFALIALVYPKLQESVDIENVEKSRAYSRQVEAITAISAVKMAGLEEEVYKGWHSIFLTAVRRFVTRIRYSYLQTIVTESIQMFAPIFVLLIGLFLFMSNLISLGEAIAFQTISQMFFRFIASVYGSFTQFLVAGSFVKRVNEIWEKEQPNEYGKLVKEISGNIKLTNLSFSYSKNTKRALTNINMEVGAGEKVAIVGPSGSGKSTLGKIIVGLFQPTEGNVYIDGLDYKEYEKKALLKQMGIVPQDGILFNKSIMENILLGNEKAEESLVYEAAQVARIDEEIESLPMKYHTVVSDLGQNFSGGQRQRILIARALVNKPKVLVFDEATSSLDTINEAKISEYLSKQGCTRIIIAHRLSTIMDSDKIYVMNQGEIIACGKHEELLSKCELYNKLYYKGSVSIQA
jgi:ABC-type bacteriocin/lantibiotic exporter with double-glycine peptidase domain